MKRRLRLTFVLPFVNLTGGIKILFEHANRLSARGHQVTIIYPGKLFPNEDWRWRFIEAPLRSLKYWFFVTLLHKTDAAWFPLDRRLQLIRTPDLSARYMPPGDIVIGTAPETINQVATYPAEKGIKVHFAQDYEVWDLPVAFVDSTFRHHNTHLITIGAWQKLLYEQKFGRIVEAVIPDGVDLARFKPNGKKYPPGNERPVRVLMNYHHASYKGLADGFAAIDKVRQAGHQITTVLFGMHPLTAEVPPDVEYHQAIAEAELPTLYRSCDIFLWPTHREGFGLPPMEALACGTPVVATDSGAVADYLADGRDGFIVPIQRPDLLAKQLEKLVADPKLRTKMGQAGAKAMLAWDWDNQTDKLETYLMKLAGTIKFKWPKLYKLYTLHRTKLIARKRSTKQAMNQPKVAIIILNWNGANDTLALLANLEQLTYPNFSVLVVDNASKDDSLGQLARYMEKQRRGKAIFSLSLLPLSKNFGFAEGNNKGVAHASREQPDYYLLLNNDTLVAPDFLDRLVAAAEADEKLAAVGPTIYFASESGRKTKAVWFAGAWINFFAGGAHHRTEKSINTTTEFITGCCFLIKRAALSKVGRLFDPAFFAYSEDVDLCLRLTKLGYRLGYVPEAKIWHKLATSSGGPKSYNFWYYNVRNNFLVMSRWAKWYHWPVFIAYFLFYKPVLWSLVGAIVKPRHDKPYRLVAIAHGSYDALRRHFGQRVA